MFDAHAILNMFVALLIAILNMYYYLKSSGPWRIVKIGYVLVFFNIFVAYGFVAFDVTLNIELIRTLLTVVSFLVLTSTIASLGKAGYLGKGFKENGNCYQEEGKPEPTTPISFEELDGRN